MHEDTAEFLLSPEGRALLAQAMTCWENRLEPLAALTRLRKSAPPELAAAAWDMADLRQRARAKFGPPAAQMHFTREALEQASGARAAEYHARRFVQAGVTTIADLGGGIGGDALAFARAGLHVTLYERDPVRARFAGENARIHGVEQQMTVVQADVTQVAIDAQGGWFDPARRVDGGRIGDPEAYTPPLSFLRGLPAQGIAEMGVKLSPALDHAIAREYGAELEFISDGGECKEALLWFGQLKTGELVRATIVTDTEAISLTALPGDTAIEAGGTGRFLYEPDAAVIRAHLVRTLAHRLGAWLIDPQIAYLISDALAATPFAVAYEIIDRFPYHRKRLQDALRAYGVGQVVIKKRGFPQEPDAVRKQLKLSGPNSMTVVLTRIGDRHHAILCRPAQETARGNVSSG